MLFRSPMATDERLHEEYDLALTALDKMKPADAVIMAVAHKPYREGGWALVQSLLKTGRGFVADIPSLLDRKSTPDGVTLWRL